MFRRRLRPHKCVDALLLPTASNNSTAPLTFQFLPLAAHDRFERVVPAFGAFQFLSSAFWLASTSPSPVRRFIVARSDRAGLLTAQLAHHAILPRQRILTWT